MLTVLSQSSDIIIHKTYCDFLYCLKKQKVVASVMNQCEGIIYHKKLPNSPSQIKILRTVHITII